MISGTLYTILPGGTPIPGPGIGNGDGTNGSKKALSDGALAGIIVACLIALALIAGVFFILFRRQSRRLQNPNNRFVSRSEAAAAGGAGGLGHLYGSRQPEGSGSHGSRGSVRNMPGGAPVAGHIVVAPEMMEHPANRSNLNLQSGPMAFGTNAAFGATSGLGAVHVHDGYHESTSDGREATSSYGASGGSGPGGSQGASGVNPYGTGTASAPSVQGLIPAQSGGTGSPQSQKGSIHYI
ncbi:MAG: hypothetical protein J3Q66DRAFT_346949 [Benniella sp.]|nr:MAG: hypothetical protein J3Q66DRAFT_346949 [Benniella sp.]